MKGTVPGGTAGIRQEAKRCAGSKNVSAVSCQRPAHITKMIQPGRAGIIRAGFPLLHFFGSCISTRTTKQEYRIVRGGAYREESS